MEISEKVSRLVHSFDMKQLGVSVALPQPVLEVKLLESTFQKYSQSFPTRFTNAALHLTYRHFQKISQNSTTTPDTTYPTFEATFLRTPEGKEEFQKNILEASQKLPQTIPYSVIQDYLKTF
jgi:hypothetical protein